MCLDLYEDRTEKEKENQRSSALHGARGTKKRIALKGPGRTFLRALRGRSLFFFPSRALPFSIKLIDALCSRSPLHHPHQSSSRSRPCRALDGDPRRRRVFPRRQRRGPSLLAMAAPAAGAGGGRGGGPPGRGPPPPAGGREPPRPPAPNGRRGPPLHVRGALSGGEVRVAGPARQRRGGGRKRGGRRRRRALK